MGVWSCVLAVHALVVLPGVLGGGSSPTRVQAVKENWKPNGNYHTEGTNVVAFYSPSPAGDPYRARPSGLRARLMLLFAGSFLCSSFSWAATDSSTRLRAAHHQSHSKVPQGTKVRALILVLMSYTLCTHYSPTQNNTYAVSSAASTSVARDADGFSAFGGAAVGPLDAIPSNADGDTTSTGVTSSTSSAASLATQGARARGPKYIIQERTWEELLTQRPPDALDSLPGGMRHYTGNGGPYGNCISDSITGTGALEAIQYMKDAIALDSSTQGLWGLVLQAGSKIGLAGDQCPTDRGFQINCTAAGTYDAKSAKRDGGLLSPTSSGPVKSMPDPTPASSTSTSSSSSPAQTQHLLSPPVPPIASPTAVVHTGKVGCTYTIKFYIVPEDKKIPRQHWKVSHVILLQCIMTPHILHCFHRRPTSPWGFQNMNTWCVHPPPPQL